MTLTAPHFMLPLVETLTGQPTTGDRTSTSCAHWCVTFKHTPVFQACIVMIGKRMEYWTNLQAHREFMSVSFGVEWMHVINSRDAAVLHSKQHNLVDPRPKRT